MLIKFKKPHKFENQEYTELDLDLENLTGRELLDAVKETKALGDFSPVVEMTKTYYAIVAAKAAKVPVELIISLPAKDFTQITINTQDFLVG